MKHISLFIAIIILCHPLLPIAEYVVNYKYISEVLCINKEKPKMECHGKCHLGKEFAKEMNGNSSKKNSETAQIKIEILFFNNETLSVQKNFYLAEENITKYFFKEKLHSYNYRGISLQPPQKVI